MVKKFGGLVFEFHRPAWAKTFKNEKDKFQESLPDSLRLRASGQAKPMLRVRAATPRDALSTVREINQAIMRTPLLHRVEDLRDHVRGHLDNHLATDARRPLIVLIGESHKPRSARSAGTIGTGEAIAMTVTERLSSVFDRKQFLVELQPSHVNIERTKTLDDLGPAIDLGLTSDARFDKTEDGPFAIQMMYARRHRFEVRGFDPLRKTARDLESREAAMVDTLLTQRLKADVTVVQTGARHLPTLHAALAANGTNVFSLAMLDDCPAREDHVALKREGDILANDAIVKVRASAATNDPLLSGVDPVAFARQLEQRP